MRHARVRNKKFAKNGTISNASTAVFAFGPTLNASKYATGRLTTRHSTVPRIDVYIVCFSSERNDPLTTSR